MLSNWLDASSSSNRYQQMYIKGFLDISGGNLILRNNNLHILKGDANLNGRLLLNGDASFNGNLTIGNDLKINGRLYATYADSSIPINAIMGGIPGTSGVFEIDLSMNKRLYVQGDVSLNSNLYVSKTGYFNSDLSVNNRLFVKGTATVGNLTTTGNANITNLRATNIYENGTLIYTKYAPINSPTFTGTVTGITSSMIGLGNVNNTSDADKPISTATQSALNLLVSSESPNLTGVPTSTTAGYRTNTNQIATTSYVITGLSGLISTAPAKLSTLAQLASAINNDPSFNSTIIYKYAPLTTPYFINYLTTPKIFVTSDSSLNGKVFINGDASLNSNLLVGKNIFESGVSLKNKYSAIASPTFTGVVTMPTAIINQKLVTIGDVSMNGRLFLEGDSVLNGNLVTNYFISNNDSTMNSKLIVIGDTSLNSNVIIGKDLTVNGNLIVKTYTAQQTVTSTNYQFIVAEDMSLNGRLFITGDVSMNNNLYLGRDISVNGNLFVNGNTKINGTVNVITPSSTDNSTLVATTAFVKNQEYAKISGGEFTGDVSMNTNLQVIGNLITNTASSSDNSTLVATTAFVKNQEYAKISGGEFTGDVSMNTNLQVIGNLITNTAVSSDNSTLVATTAFVKNQLTSLVASPNFSGDVTMDNLNVNNSTNIIGNLHVKTKTILDNDVSMNRNLDLSGSIIAHNNVNVYGIINQYTTTLDQGYIVNYSNINASGDLIANGVKLSANINDKNTFYGMTAGNLITSGINNTFIGYGAGSNITTGSNNIIIGNGSQGSIPSVSNEITIGNNSIATLRCNVQTITSLSDERDKKNIVKLPLGLDFINDLKPVEFEWDSRDGTKIGGKEFGFIAQELKKSQENFGITVPKLINDLNPDKLEASYSVLIPILVNSIKELKEMTAKQQIEINDLKQKLYL